MLLEYDSAAKRFRATEPFASNGPDILAQGRDGVIYAPARNGLNAFHPPNQWMRLTTDHGVILRDVRALSGYLSGDPARLHFGVPAGATVQRLELRWPDGAVSQIDAPPINHLLTVTRQP